MDPLTILLLFLALLCVVGVKWLDAAQHAEDEHSESWKDRNG